MFASLGWGIFSALSGLLVSRFSIYTAFQLYFALEAFAIIPVCFLKFHAKPHLAQVKPQLVLQQSCVVYRNEARERTNGVKVQIIAISCQALE